MNKYYKNFILCGDIDQYCLLCHESFHLIPDIEKHIRWEKHRKNLKDLSCLPKFRKDFIYKIGNSFYCEKCNLVTPNIASVTEHIKCERHKLLLSNPDAEIKKPAGLYDSGYFIINKVILNKAQWNSVVDNKCLICNIAVKNIDDHIALPEHIIKLIQSETKYADNQYYRKINDETYHCFACKKIFSPINFANHWVNCENKDEIEIKKLKEAKTSRYIGTMTEDIGRMAELEKKLVETLQEFYSIDEGSNVATCKYCNNPVAINFKSMIEHMKQQHDKQGLNICCKSSSESSEEKVVYREVADNGKKRSELAKYGKANYIKLNFNGGKGYCTLCDKYMSAHKSVFREHAKGDIHRGHLELLGVKKPKERDIFEYNTQSITSFLTIFQYCEDLLAVWINNELRIEVYSLFLLHQITKNPHCVKTKCYACNELFEQAKEKEHCLTSKHQRNFFAAKVILKSEEFIRVLRPHVFHCGYCNSTLPFSDTLEKHLQTLQHRKNKTERMMIANAVKFSPIFNPFAINFTTSDGDWYLKLLDHVYA